MQLDSSIYGNLKLKNSGEVQAELAQAEHAQQQLKFGKVQTQREQGLVDAQKATKANAAAVNQTIPKFANPDGSVDYVGLKSELARQGFAKAAMDVDAHIATINKDKRSAQLSELQGKVESLKINAGVAARTGALAATVNSATSAAHAIRVAHQEGIIDDQYAEHLNSLPWNADTQAIYQQIAKSGMDAETQSKVALAQAEGQRKIIEAEDKHIDEQNKNNLAVPQLAKAENEAKTSAPNAQGLTPDQTRMADQEAARLKQTAAEGAANRQVTREGHTMTDARGRDLAEATRSSKPLTEAELKTYGYYGRAKQAGAILDQLDPEIAKKGTIGQLTLRNAPNLMQSDDNQAYKQAERQFIEAYLRRDSGAAISQGEYESARQTLFAQPGDAPKILKQKANGRAEILKSLAVGSGRAMERFGEDAPSTGKSSGDGGPKNARPPLSSFEKR